MTIPLTKSYSQTEDPRSGFTVKQDKTEVRFVVPTDEDGARSAVEILTSQVGVLNNGFDKLAEQLSSQPQRWSTFIIDLADAGYELLSPLPVVLEQYQDEDSIIARSPELEVLGEGATEAEALGVLKNEILDLFDELNELEHDELGDLPLSWLRILQQRIRVVR